MNDYIVLHNKWLYAIEFFSYFIKVENITHYRLTSAEH